MRGKHSTASANRRERVELEQRAVTAEARVERLEKELGELRAASQDSINALRAALSQARKDRDAAVSPLLGRENASRLEAELQRDQAVIEQRRLKALMDARHKRIRESLGRLEEDLPEKAWAHVVTQVIEAATGLPLSSKEAIRQARRRTANSET